MKVKEESENVGLKLNIQKKKIMASSPITSWQIDEETVETVSDFIFGAPKSLQIVIAAIKRHLLLGRSVIPNLDSILKSRDITLPTKVCLVNAMVFPVVMYGCEIWTVKKAECQKNWCFWTVVFEKTLESPLDCKGIQPVCPEGNQPWVFIGRTDVEAETPMFWPPDAKSSLIWKDPGVGKDWTQEEKEMTEDEMVKWHHQLDGLEFKQAQGVDDGQESLACLIPWVTKGQTWLSDWATEQQEQFLTLFLIVVFFLHFHR